jgi:hypothetical protein
MISLAHVTQHLVYPLVFLLLGAPQPVALLPHISRSPKHLHQSLILLQESTVLLTFLLQPLVL